MAKRTGLGMRVDVDSSDGTARTISNDITQISFSTPRGSQDVTGIDKSAMEKLLLLADGKVSFTGVFNDGALAAAGTNSGSHLVLRTVPSSSVQRTVAMTLPGGAVLTMEMLFTDYALSRSQSGELTWTAPAELMDGNVPTWA